MQLIKGQTSCPGCVCLCICAPSGQIQRGHSGLGLPLGGAALRSCPALGTGGSPAFWAPSPTPLPVPSSPPSLPSVLSLTNQTEVKEPQHWVMTSCPGPATLCGAQGQLGGVCPGHMIPKGAGIQAPHSPLCPA